MRAKPTRESKVAPIQLIMADSQPLDRAGLAAILRSEPDFDVIAEAGTTEEVIRASRRQKPSVIVVALRLAAPQGRTALAHLREQLPDIPILAVAERGEGQCMVLHPPGSDRGMERDPGRHCSTGTDCLELAVTEGASGTIRRSANPQELFQAVRAVASGRAWYEAGTATAIMKHALARRSGDGAPPPLSEREIEVAELIAEGRSNKEIAKTLGIAETTIKKHVGHILVKLKLQDRLQIGLHVARNPLVLRNSLTRQR